MKGGTIAQAQDIPLRFLENILDVLEVVTLADVVERVLPPSVVKLTEGALQDVPDSRHEVLLLARPGFED